MPKFPLLPTLVVLCATALFAAEAPPAKPASAKPVLKIIPGQVVVPTDAMRRIWGELVSIDFKTRTGTFRKEGTDEIIPFTVLPYSELLHHAAFGDLQDFRLGVRAIFRLHQNEKGDWVWLTYIQDQMNMMNGHKEYFYVEAIDAAKGTLSCTQANADKSFVREKGILIETDAETKYWKLGAPATFADLKVGERLRTETHGVGKGKHQVCWNVFLDDESLLKFQTAQKQLNTQRLAAEGVPGYADSNASGIVTVTLFQESGDIARGLKPGQKVRLARAGADRQPTAAAIGAVVAEAKMQGNLGKVKLTLSTDASFAAQPGDIIRLWNK